MKSITWVVGFDKCELFMGWGKMLHVQPELIIINERTLKSLNRKSGHNGKKCRNCKRLEGSNVFNIGEMLHLVLQFSHLQQDATIKQTNENIENPDNMVNFCKM